MTLTQAPPIEIERRRIRPTLVRWAGLVVLALALFATIVLSITLGSRSITFDGVVSAFAAFDPANTEHVIIRELRVPRTILGLLVGAALGLAGTLMQGVTRNPIADPGLLGVNAGASLFVVVGIASFGMTALTSYVWFAFAGAAAASVIVYLIAAAGRDGATPVKLALAGAAISAGLASVTTAVLLLDAQAFNSFRFWAIGSMAGRQLDIVTGVLPFLLVGVALALGAGRMLNGLALGDDVATALGQRVALSRIMAGIAIVVLCGAATAAIGPIAFVGLIVPHIARSIVGADYRWILVYSLFIGGVLLIAADIIGRVIAAPRELQVGVVTAAIGGPVFIALVRRKKLAAL